MANVETVGIVGAGTMGFGIAHVVDGKAHLQFVPMRHYTVILDGKVFRG